MAEIKDPYYSMSEIMKHLSICRDAALRWIITKEITVHKVGKSGNSSSPRSING